MMIRPGSVKTVRPPCWTSCRCPRNSSIRRGPCTAAPGAIGVRAAAGGGAAGSGVVTCGGARRTKFGAPVGGAVWVPWPGVGVAVGAAGAAPGEAGAGVAPGDGGGAPGVGEAAGAGAPGGGPVRAGGDAGVVVGLPPAGGVVVGAVCVCGAGVGVAVGVPGNGLRPSGG